MREQNRASPIFPYSPCPVQSTGLNKKACQQILAHSKPVPTLSDTHIKQPRPPIHPQLKNSRGTGPLRLLRAHQFFVILHTIRSQPFVLSAIYKQMLKHPNPIIPTNRMPHCHSKASLLIIRVYQRHVQAEVPLCAPYGKPPMIVKLQGQDVCQ